MDLIIFAFPPGLPAVMLVIGAVARGRLLRDGLLLKFPEILKLGAAVDVVCFDKTGTLTSSAVSVSFIAATCSCSEQMCFDKTRPLTSSAVSVSLNDATWTISLIIMML